MGAASAYSISCSLDAFLKLYFFSLRSLRFFYGIKWEIVFLRFPFRAAVRFLACLLLRSEAFLLCKLASTAGQRGRTGALGLTVSVSVSTHGDIKNPKVTQGCPTRWHHLGFDTPLLLPWDQREVISPLNSFCCSWRERSAGKTLLSAREINKKRHTIKQETPPKQNPTESKSRSALREAGSEKYNPESLSTNF